MLCSHLHGCLDVHSPHQPVLRHSQGDLDKGRVAHAAGHLAPLELLQQAVLHTARHSMRDARSSR